MAPQLGLIGFKVNEILKARSIYFTQDSAGILRTILRGKGRMWNRVFIFFSFSMALHMRTASSVKSEA
jgi:hypothetical protein